MKTKKELLNQTNKTSDILSEIKKLDNVLVSHEKETLEDFYPKFVVWVFSDINPIEYKRKNTWKIEDELV